MSIKNMVAIRGEFVVQFCLRPGDESVELYLVGNGNSSAIPDVLSDLQGIKKASKT